jgi:OmpA-OmpF porin, OOP family
MIPLTLAIAASAQVVPPVDAEPYRASIDNPRLSWVDTADRPNPGPFFAVGARYTRDAMLYAQPTGISPVLRDAALADLAAGYGFGPVRLGMVAPILVRGSGWGGGETGLGDVAAAARGTVLDTSAVDLAFDGRLWLPTTTVAAPIGDRAVSGEVAAVLSAELGPVLLALNNGYRALPSANLDGVPIDDVVTSRLGVGVGIGERAGVSTELAAQSVLRAPTGATLPVDVLVGGWFRTAGPIGVRMGVGRGLTAAIGSPTFRAVAALTYTAPLKARDTDRDGLLDADDACPRDAEDGDGWQDEDGCPERPELIVELVDEAGAPVTARAALVGAKYELPFTRTARLEVDPGAYTLVAHADGYADALTALTVVDGPPRTVRLTLHPVRVVVSRERFDLRGEIFFGSGSDVILSDSFGLLDEVARALADTPQILRLRVEGHTDTVGRPRENLALSQRRAESVRRYLTEQGIDGARLVAVGYGERRPLVSGPDELESAENRRVEFIVEEWSDATE